MTITQIDNSDKGIFQAKENGVTSGEMDYTWEGTNKIVIEHTNVNQNFSGRGVGKALVMEAVLFARENNIKIFSRCPFAKSMFAKTEEIRDVLF